MIRKQKTGTVQVRLCQHLSSVGRTHSYRLLNGPHQNVQQCYGVSVDKIIQGLSAEDMADGSVFELTATLVKRGKAT